MTITIIGTGFVGVVSSAVFASLGNRVFGLDVDQSKIDKLTRGEIPFYEPGLKELVTQGVQIGALSFTTKYEEAIPQSDVIMIAVGTPSAPDGQADLKYVFASVEQLAPLLKDQAIVAIKSTVPPGTNKKVEEIIHQQTQKTIYTASLPEFLKEGSAVQDTLHPDRVVIGATNPFTIQTLTGIHQPLSTNIIVMRPESAQMCKYAANAYLATRITFINQIANLCEVNGANIQEVIQGIGHDKRIGKHYWYPGFGYGGSCFPKDVKELAAYSKAIGQNGNLMVKINELNEERIPLLLNQYEQKYGSFAGKKVAVLGLSFKPNTDDLREAPSLKVIPFLLDKGAQVVAYDPMAMPVTQKMFPNWTISYARDPYEALQDADCIIELVEWQELISLDVNQIAQRAKPGVLFIDARNQYGDRRTLMQSLGIRYQGIGMS